MNKIIYLFFILLIILIIQHRTIRMNIFVFTAISRGILAPSCFWWSLSQALLTDDNGLKLYEELKTIYGDFAPLNILGTKMFMPTNIQLIRQILDNSPNIFSVGKLKYKFFKSFMKYNVGVSSGDAWVQRRRLNEKVLFSGCMHKYANYHNNIISSALKQNIPQNFKDFQKMSKIIIAQIVFNKKTIPDEIFEVFEKANSVRAVIDSNYQLPLKLNDFFQDFIWKELQYPKSNSLLSLCSRSNLNKQELIDQVPHWIFPIGGLIHSNIPRVLALLCMHNNSMEKVKNELKYIDLSDSFAIYGAIYLRKCILETLRMNNPVTSTFRTLTKSFTFQNGESFPKDTQFIILNNGVMRDKSCFNSPNNFIPERWIKGKEKEYCSLMFNQGPQRCPGKEMAIFIMASFIGHYLKEIGVLDNLTKIRCNKPIGQIINPCALSFIF